MLTIWQEFGRAGRDGKLQLRPGMPTVRPMQTQAGSKKFQCTTPVCVKRCWNDSSSQRRTPPISSS